MKEYEKQVLWLDYFNSELKRNQGRRVPLNIATRAPTLQELEDACRRLNLQPVSQAALYPSRRNAQSGYVSVRKAKPKQSVVLKVAKELSVVRGQAQKRQGQPQQGKKK